MVDCVAMAAAAGLLTATATVGVAEAQMEDQLDPTELEWRTIDDVVMGGVSRSSVAMRDGFMTFSGVVSLENNGGFASVRTLPSDHDLSSYDGLIVHLRGDGKGYAFRLRTTSDFDGVSYQVLVQPPAREWTDVVVRFADFEPVFRGRRVSGHPPLDPGRIKTFGFLISQKQDGRFELDVGPIRGWVDPTKGRPDAAGSER